MLGALVVRKLTKMQIHAELSCEMYGRLRREVNTYESGVIGWLPVRHVLHQFTNGIW